MKYFKSNNSTNTIDIQNDNDNNGIMVVDDSKFSRNILSDILKNEGFHVIAEAKNGLEAIDLAKEKKPKYIFLDVEMPMLDGLGALPKLLEADPDAHIIMCTAMGQKNIIVEAAKAGAKDYVLKPYKRENIVRVLSVIME
jgi:two-component system chemotaxis response regulator CheY